MVSDSKQRWMLVIAALLLAVSGYYVWRVAAAPSAGSYSRERIYMCAESGKVFRHEPQVGEIEPIYSPFTKRNTGYMPEACYWVKSPDGQWKAKKNPTYVIERRRLGEDGTTYCPDCGRKVIGHNPMPPKELMDAAE